MWGGSRKEASGGASGSRRLWGEGLLGRSEAARPGGEGKRDVVRRGATEEKQAFGEELKAGGVRKESGLSRKLGGVWGTVATWLCLKVFVMAEGRRSGDGQW